MGYTIRIGEAEIYKDEELTYIDISARKEKHDDAPAFGEYTDGMNERWPSYGQWAEFVREAGLEETFSNPETGLMRKHPGVSLITIEHQGAIRSALTARQKRGTLPGFPDDTGNHKLDPILARLIWLDYWVTWAVINCKNPVMTNS